MSNDDKITKIVIQDLISEKLTPGKPVEVKRDWIDTKNAHVCVYQERKFKFFLACESKEEDLDKMEELLSECLELMGFKTSRTYSH